MANEAQPFDDRTPLTEGQIRAATIGELKPLSGLIRIVDYDPRWSELFAREADRVRAGCASDRARRFDVGAGPRRQADHRPAPRGRRLGR